MTRPFRRGDGTQGHRVERGVTQGPRMDGASVSRHRHSVYRRFPRRSLAEMALQAAPGGGGGRRDSIPHEDCARVDVVVVRRAVTARGIAGDAEQYVAL